MREEKYSALNASAPGLMIRGFLYSMNSCVTMRAILIMRNNVYERTVRASFSPYGRKEFHYDRK